MNINMYRILTQAAQEQLNGRPIYGPLPVLPGHACTATGNPPPVVDERSHLMGFLDAIAWLNHCKYINMEAIRQDCSHPTDHQSAYIAALLAYCSDIEEEFNH